MFVLIQEPENTARKYKAFMNNRLLRVLKIRPFFYLWMAEIFSQIAVNMLNFILIVVAFELTSSNTAVSGIVLSFTIPAILLGVLAGVYVDRRNKKTMLVVTNMVRGFLLLLLVFFHANIFFIYAISLLIAIVTQFFIPAETPIIPLLVNKNLLLSANALFGVGIFGSVLIAYALSGPFLLFFQQTYVFMVLAIFFFIASIFSLLIQIPQQKKSVLDQQSGQFNVALKDEIKNLFRLMSRTKAIYSSLFLLTMSQVIVLVLAVIGPGYASQILGIKVYEFPLAFVTPAALGMFLGAILIGNFFHNRAKEKMTTIGVMLSGVTILLLPYGSKVASRGFVQAINGYLPHIFVINILHFMVFLAFLLGFANALIFVPSNTILQEKTTDAFRGKVYGALNALVGIFSLLPIILVGGLADLIGVGRVITGIGSSILFLGVLRFLFSIKH